MIIGIDVSKDELIGVRIDRRGVVKERYRVENTASAINEFLNTFPKKILMGSEATGEYHNVLAQLCLARGIPFKVLNPIVTKQFVKATVRKKKTDLSDAEVIARCLLQGEGQLVDDSCFSSGKFILRTASELAELEVSVRHMARRYSTHYQEETAVIDELTALSLAIKETMERVRGYGVGKGDRSVQTLLISIPGVGKTLSAVLQSEIGSIDRFSARSLVAYAGLDPKVRQSGYSLKRNTRLTKRGSPYLRRALFIAASIGQRCDPELKQYYEKKRGEGKRYREATVANARHILFRVYAVWKRGTPYVPIASPQKS